MAKMLRYLATGHTQQDYSFMQNEPLATSLSEKFFSLSRSSVQKECITLWGVSLCELQEVDGLVRVHRFM